MSKKEYASFEANLILRGKIECLTGLHIGGSKEKLEIGGVDSIVVRSPRSNYPYIPGSSIKGKLRHLLEYTLDGIRYPVLQKEGQKIEDALGNVSRKEEITRIFGAGVSEKEIKANKLQNIGLTRLVVRDAMPDSDTIRMWKSLGSDANYTEYKAENTIDRITSAANPRFIERVVEGSQFDFEMIYSVYKIGDQDPTDKVNEDIRHILMGLRLLESFALGKSGSRGYGKIRFHMATPIWLTKDDYKEGSENWKTSRIVAGAATLNGLENI
jgi:CRISPR-associated protein Csm3